MTETAAIVPAGPAQRALGGLREDLAVAHAVHAQRVDDVLEDRERERVRAILKSLDLLPTK